MLMRTHYDTLSKVYSTDHNDAGNDKFGSKWERTDWKYQSYRCPTPDCDTKRTGPCKRPKDTEA